MGKYIKQKYYVIKATHSMVRDGLFYSNKGDLINNKKQIRDGKEITHVGCKLYKNEVNANSRAFNLQREQDGYYKFNFEVVEIVRLKKVKQQDKRGMHVNDWAVTKNKSFNYRF